MTDYCDFHEKEHESWSWRTWTQEGKLISFCRDGLDEASASYEGAGFFIGTGHKDARLNYWKEIKSRVTTHEGELLSGNKGREYQQKYSKQYLGKDMSQPVNFNKPEYQKELNK